jgi:hypothetical protein
MLKDRTAEGELDGRPAPESAAHGRKAPPSGPKRYIRRSTKGALLCYTCVEEIARGAAYIKCGCGKVVHVSCLKEPHCPCCGAAFGRAAPR